VPGFKPQSGITDILYEVSAGWSEIANA
jgi:hypothetical protein